MKLKQMCLSYLSFGLLSVLFQHFSWEQNSSINHFKNNAEELSDHSIKLNEIISQSCSQQEKSSKTLFFTSPRLYKSPIHSYSKEIETDPKKHRLEILNIKYKNFVFSPKTYFVFETVI